MLVVCIIYLLICHTISHYTINMTKFAKISSTKAVTNSPYTCDMAFKIPTKPILFSWYNVYTYVNKSDPPLEYTLCNATTYNYND